MDWIELLPLILRGWIRLTVSVAFGIALGALLEVSGLLEKISRVLLPLMKRSKLPAVCTSSFLLSFASPRSANSLLASYRSDGLISRRSLILGGIAHSFPASFVHIRTSMFIIIPLLGTAGAVYAGFQITINALCSLSVILLGHIWKEQEPCSTPISNNPSNAPRSGLIELMTRRFKRIYPRVMLISFPLFIVISILSRYGVFDRINEVLPSALTRVLPSQSIGILTGHLSGVLNAAVIAQPLLDGGDINSRQLVFTLIIGYALSLPIRTLRHVLPSALGIFPERTGLTIVAYTQGFKLALTAALIACILLLGVNA
ncbi:MAG: hypothetical protein B0D92_04975 [Spirochaeta sp. LUC14_002_19_P3]|nr:MAG: hypothetical protein B0D92_04975 [Spirochaeta sp. LUC14_002_19_P3]